MTYSSLNKMEYSSNEIMMENCDYIYSMDAANTVELGLCGYQEPMKICFL